MAIYMKFLRESMASTSELAHNVEHDLLIILSYRPSKLQLGSRRTRKALPQPVGVTYAIVRARRTLATLQLPASSLILHLSLIHSLLLLSTPLVALYNQHRFEGENAHTLDSWITTYRDTT
jgi:hypothetical protein